MTEIKILIFVILSAKICWFRASSAHGIQMTSPACEFDSSLQGTYRIQDDATESTTARRRSKAFSSLTSSFQQREPVKYKDLFIGPTSIPQWGDCSRKDNSRYVLGSRQGSGHYCYRCFLIVQRTPNVLQVINSDELACFPTIEIAQTSCAYPEKISASEGIFLWRSENVQYQFCPVGGRANITYSLNRRTYCPYPARLPSTIDNCRLGYQMDVILNSCFFPIPDNFEMSLKCLGSWDAGRSDGETFFAVYNALTDEFRCGLFRDDRRRYGYATAALSNDSSCSSMLNGSTSGFETFTLFSDMDLNNAIGTKLSTFKAQCSFPKWLQADNWDTSMIIRDGLIDFYDQNNPDTMIKIKGKCHSITIDDLPDKAVVKIRSETHCDAFLQYRCLWFERRSNDIVEVRSTLAPADTNGSYCNQEKTYKSTKWTIMNQFPPENVSCIHNYSRHAFQTILFSQGVSTTTFIPLFAAKTPNHIFVPCGYLGDFATHDRLSFKLPKNHLYCTNVTFDCFDSTKFTMNQYSCSTNQVVSEFKYRCIASWSDDGDKFTYVLEESKLAKECIGRSLHIFAMHNHEVCETKKTSDSRYSKYEVSRNFSSNGTSLILLIFTGRHCEREALDRSYLQNLEINTLSQPYRISNSVANFYNGDLEAVQQDRTVYKALLLENQESCSRYFEKNRYEFADDLRQVNAALIVCYACVNTMVLVTLLYNYSFIELL